MVADLWLDIVKGNTVRTITLGGNRSFLLIRIRMTLNNFISDHIFFFVISSIYSVHIVFTEYWKHSWRKIFLIRLTFWRVLPSIMFNRLIKIKETWGMQLLSFCYFYEFTFCCWTCDNSPLSGLNLGYIII